MPLRVRQCLEVLKRDLLGSALTEPVYSLPWLGCQRCSLETSTANYAAIAAGEERSIVSSMSGTTRDAIDTDIIGPDGRTFKLIDTAGIRRRTAVAGVLRS